MKQIVCFIVLVIALSGCKAKSTPVPEAPKPQESGLYNISQIPGFAALKRQVVRLDYYEDKKTFSGTPDIKDSYKKISFPFPFTVKESYIKKGDRVKKGDPLFLLQSEKMEEAMIRYQKTREPGLGAALQSAGIALNDSTSPMITIISPAAGEVIATYKDDLLRAKSLQNLALLQVKNDLNILISVPLSAVTEDSRFYVNLNGVSMPLKLVSSSGENNLTVNLVLENAGDMPDSERLQVTVVNGMSETFLLTKEAVFSRNGKNYCLVEVSDGVLAQREISGVTGTYFVVTQGLKENETVVNDNVKYVLERFKI